MLTINFSIMVDIKDASVYMASAEKWLDGWAPLLINRSGIGFQSKLQLQQACPSFILAIKLGIG